MRILNCVVTGQPITLVKEIARSGEGTVWETNRSNVVAKIYHDPTPARIKKLQIMIAHPPIDPMRDRNHVTFAWPQDIIQDSKGQSLGFIMPKVQDSVTLSTIYNPRLRSRKAPRFNWHYLHTTALNIALAAQSLHQEGYVIGDVKPQNILVNKNALISIIDTDSFQVKDPYSQQVFRCLVGSEGFTPAELLGKELSDFDQSEVHDRFRIAVIIYLLLFGDHPFKGKWIARGESPLPTDLIRHGYWPYAQRSLIKPGPNTIPLTVVHSRLQSQFHICFTQGHSNPHHRPSADEWVSALRTAIADLKTCASEANHLYNRAYGRCYWCDRKAKLGIDIFNPDLKAKLDLERKAKAARKVAQANTRLPLHSFAQSSASRRHTQMGSLTVPTQRLSSSNFTLSQVRQKIATLPPTLVGSLLCISSLFGLGLLLIPEIEYHSVERFPDLVEDNLRSLFQIGNSQPYASKDVSSIVAKDLSERGLSHADTVTQISISPDGRFVASGSRDMSVKLWDVESGQFIRSLTEHFEPINFVRFTQDGTALMSSSQSGTVVLWSVPQGKVLKTLDKSSETGGGSLLNATVDDDERFLVSNGWSGGILIHNLITNQIRRIETNTLASEQALLALPKSHGALLSTTSSGQVNVWNLKDGKPQRSFPGIGEWQPIEPVRVMAASQDGDLVATGNWSGTVNLWDQQQGIILKSLNGHSPSYICSMAISPNGKWLATGGGDHLIKLWNLNTGNMVKILDGHKDDVTALEFSPNNKVLMSGSQDKTVKVWAVPSGELARTLVQ